VSSPAPALPYPLPPSFPKYRLKIFTPAGHSVYRASFPFLLMVIIPSPDNFFICQEIDGPATPTLSARSFRETSRLVARISRILRVVRFWRYRNTFFSTSPYRPLFSKYRMDLPVP